MDARIAALALVAACSSSGMRMSPCKVEPIPRASCAEPMTLSELRSRADTLMGTHVTITGPLQTMLMACDDCCPGVAGQLALVQREIGVVVSLSSRWCFTDSNGNTECPLQPDGRAVTFHGRLGMAIHGGDGDLVLQQSELCETP